MRVFPLLWATSDDCRVEWRSYTEECLDSTGLFRDVVIANLAVIAKPERVRLSERHPLRLPGCDTGSERITSGVGASSWTGRRPATAQRRREPSQNS